MRKNLIQDKSFSFALKVVKLYQIIGKTHKEYIMSKQLLRSGTSVGANIREATQAESKADFIHKMSISLKEASETAYWLDLLFHSNYINKGKN